MTRFGFVLAALAFLARPAAAQTRRPDQTTFEIIQALRALEARVKALEARVKSLDTRVKALEMRIK